MNYSHGGTWVVLQQIGGGAFAATLAWALLAFPYYKGMPLGYVPVIAGAGLAVVMCRRRTVAYLRRMLTKPREYQFLAVTIGLALAARVVTILLIQNEPVSDFLSYDRNAIALASGAGFPPSAYYPPGMSFWLAGIYSITGPSYLAAQLGNAAIGGLMTWLTYVVARQVLTVAAARLAALMVAVFPSLVLDATTLDYGPLLGCALLAAIALFQRRHTGREHPWWQVVLIGVLLAGVSFLKPIGLLLPFVFGLCYWRRGTPPGRAVFHTVLLLGTMLVTLSPWSYRNYQLFGKYIPVTTSGGAGLWVSNNPRANGLTMSLPRFVAEVSELERDRLLWQQAWHYLGEHPDHILRLAPAKMAYMWGTSSTILSFVKEGQLPPRIDQALKLLINCAWTFVCMLVIVGIWSRGLSKSAAIFWPLLCLVLYVWAIHQFYEVQSKYHLPVLPMMFICASAALLRIRLRMGFS